MTLKLLEFPISSTIWENWAAELGGLCILLNSIPVFLRTLGKMWKLARTVYGTWVTKKECTAPKSRSRTALPASLPGNPGFIHSLQGRLEPEMGSARHPLPSGFSQTWIWTPAPSRQGAILLALELLTLSQISPLPGGQVMQTGWVFPWLISYYSALTLRICCFVGWFFFFCNYFSFKASEALNWFRKQILSPTPSFIPDFTEAQSPIE